MNTEITDDRISSPTGCIFFDAECRLCLAHRRRWGRIFERRGFVWRPLQDPGTAGRLGITDVQLREEMWLQLADGRTYSGVNAWGVLMRRVWWLWPLGCALALPGFHELARAVYRRIARNRQCLGGACTIPAPGRPPRDSGRNGMGNRLDRSTI